ncbi:MAG: alpha/beta fold hydrolase [Anaerolineae bacterium]|nr:alpha/beta fold hydrolase [Anaerolineae bacterium]
MSGYAPGGAPFAFPGQPGNTIGCLLVHGFTGMAQEMRPLGEYLAARGCGVVGVRLAGHGTTMADLERTTWQDWVASAWAGLQELRQRHTHVFAIGLSTGGAISLYLAAREPLTGVVGLSTLLRVPRGGWQLRYIRWLKYLKRYVEKGAPDWWDAEAAARHVSYPFYPTRGVEQLAKLLAALRASLPQVRVPAFIMHSRHDGAVPVAHAQEIYDGLGSADKELVFIEGSGHLITEDAQREQVAARVWDWAQRHLTPA